MHDDGAVRLAPIQADDLDDVGAFLHAHLNPRVSAAAWARAAVPTWPVEAPDHGFLLRDAGRVVGVQLAFYSTRTVAGQEERFCNLGAWCVLESHRSQGLRLLLAVLGRRGYTFTDLSPSGSVVALNTRLRFERIDTATALVPHLGLAARGGARIVSDLDALEALLDEAEGRILRDHRDAAATLHLGIVEGERVCHVVLRRDRRRGLPVFASVLHASDAALLRRRVHLVGRHLLLRHGVMALLVEVRHVGERPQGSALLPHPRPKMYRSSRLVAHQVDDLYSELALVAW